MDTPPRRKISRQQMMLIRKRKRQKRLISACFVILIAIVLITLAVVLLSKLMPNDAFSFFNNFKQVLHLNDNVSKGEEILHPTAEDLDPDVVKTLYVDVDRNDIFKGKLLLVNHSHEYKFQDDQSQFVPVISNCSPSYTANGDDLILQKQTIDAMNLWMDAFFRETGHNDIIVYSAYRSQEAQQDIINYYKKVRGQAYVDAYVSPVGYSEHHTGLAMDIDIKTEDGISTYYGKDDYAWATEHAPDYGFILRYTYEKAGVTGYNYESWHFRYVGIPHAQAMNEKNYCLEEYIDYVTLFSYETEHIQISATDGNYYEIYYYPATEDKTQRVPVPRDALSYSIDGDNSLGFIVTVQRNSPQE